VAWLSGRLIPGLGCLFFLGALLRILHTSDWHLGISTGPASRVEEQRQFLSWLHETLATREVDALIVAGDIFDTMHPSAEVQELYYEFLASLGDSGVRDVVVIGGNHDSASRLDAPSALLRAVGVHVVGGVPSGDGRAARMVAPLRARGAEAPGAVCLAVPYVHEYRLGIRTTDLDHDQIRAEFQRVFSELYTELADAAEAAYPGLPIVATGHLTLGFGATRDDYPQEIHRVGQIEGLPTDIIDPRIRYMALGHIHRSYQIGRSQAWYSGSPVPYSLTEMGARRRVLLVELDSEGEPRVEAIEVPRQRDLIKLEGSPDEVVASLASLSWSTPRPPLVHVLIETQMAEPGLQRRLSEATVRTDDAGGQTPRPVLVEVKQRATATERDAEAAPLPSLDGLEPDDVFGLMCDAKHLEGEPRAQIVEAFRRVASANYQTIQEMVEDIPLPPLANGGGAT
jgi:exonuclease SbcD